MGLTFLISSPFSSTVICELERTSNILLINFMSRKSTQIKLAWSVVVDHLNMWNALNFPPGGALEWPGAGWLSLLELNACRHLGVSSECQIIMNCNVDTSLWAYECTELKTNHLFLWNLCLMWKWGWDLYWHQQHIAIVFVLDSEVAVF